MILNEITQQFIVLPHNPILHNKLNNPTLSYLKLNGMNNSSRKHTFKKGGYSSQITNSWNELTTNYRF
jgi:hypothetical protein